MKSLHLTVPGAIWPKAKYALAGSLAAARLALYPAAEFGWLFDPNDIATLFRDEAGDMPVTAAGQKVALMLDKSGNGNHAVQPDSAKQPTYQVDGANGYLDFVNTASPTVVNCMDIAVAHLAAPRALIMALRMDGGSSTRKTLAQCYGVTTNPWHPLSIEVNATDHLDSAILASGSPSDPDAWPFGADQVISCRYDYGATNNVVLRRGGADVATGTAAGGSDVATGCRLMANRLEVNRVDGRLYGAAYVKSFSSAQAVAEVEDFFAGRLGI